MSSTGMSSALKDWDLISHYLDSHMSIYALKYTTDLFCRILQMSFKHKVHIRSKIMFKIHVFICPADFNMTGLIVLNVKTCSLGLVWRLSPGVRHSVHQNRPTQPSGIQARSFYKICQLKMKKRIQVTLKNVIRLGYR